MSSPPVMRRNWRAADNGRTHWALLPAGEGGGRTRLLVEPQPPADPGGNGAGGSQLQEGGGHPRHMVRQWHLMGRRHRYGTFATFWPLSLAINQRSGCYITWYLTICKFSFSTVLWFRIHCRIRIRISGESGSGYRSNPGSRVWWPNWRRKNKVEKFFPFFYQKLQFSYP